MGQSTSFRDLASCFRADRTRSASRLSPSCTARSSAAVWNWRQPRISGWPNALVLCSPRGHARHLRRWRRLGAHPTPDRHSPHDGHDADRSNLQCRGRGAARLLAVRGRRRPGLAKGIELAERIASNAMLSNFAIDAGAAPHRRSDPETGLLMESLMVTIACERRRGQNANACFPARSASPRSPIASAPAAPCCHSRNRGVTR